MKFNKLGLILIPLTAISTLISCNNSVEEEEAPHYTKDEYTFLKVYENSGSYQFEVYNDANPNACRKITYKINKDIKNYNYFKVEVDADCALVGWIKYCNTDTPSQENTEKFFIEEGSTEFTSFFDSFRSGAFGAFENKTVLEISFMSVDSRKEGRMEFKGLSVAEKEYYEGKMYIDDGTLRFGASTHFGGAVEYLERIDINVVEYIDAGGNVRIDKDIDPSTIASNKLISSQVNFVNVYDLGREIQPSYYLRVDKEKNGYNPQTKYNYDSLSGSFQYNPIQCGGVGDPKNNILTEPQVIDYIYKEDYIYFKTKGQDWMFINDQTQNYIEASYHFGDDGTLIVDNRSTDFYGFAGLNSVDNPMSGQETPATYFVYPLNYFYAETKSRNIFDPYLGPQNGKNSTVESPSDTVPSAGTYFYGMKASYLKNNCDWVANVNDQKFGAGLFMPNADYVVASRGNVSCQYNVSMNNGYYERLYDFGEGLTPSYAAANYNYFDLQLRRRMVEYIPLEYSYAIYVGDVDEMREAFANAKEQGLDNECLTLSEGTWPKH